MPRLMASSAEIPVIRALLTVSDAIDPVESLMMAGRSMAAITSSTMATTSIRSMTASMSSLPAMASMSTPSTAAFRSTPLIAASRSIRWTIASRSILGDDRVEVHRLDDVVDVDVAGDDAGQVQSGDDQLDEDGRPLVEQTFDLPAGPHTMPRAPAGEVGEQRGRLEAGRDERRPPPGGSSQHRGLGGGPHHRQTGTDRGADDAQRDIDDPRGLGALRARVRLPRDLDEVAHPLRVSRRDGSRLTPARMSPLTSTWPMVSDEATGTRRHGQGARAI